jgi:hypothetical protein
MLFQNLCRALTAQLSFVPPDFFASDLTQQTALETSLRELFVGLTAFLEDHDASAPTSSTSTSTGSALGTLREEQKRLLQSVRDKFGLFLESTSVVSVDKSAAGSNATAGAAAAAAAAASDDLDDAIDEDEDDEDDENGMEHGYGDGKPSFGPTLPPQASAASSSTQSLSGSAAATAAERRQLRADRYLTGFEAEDELPVIVPFDECTAALGTATATTAGEPVVVNLQPPSASGALCTSAGDGFEELAASFPNLWRSCERGEDLVMAARRIVETSAKSGDDEEDDDMAVDGAGEGGCGSGSGSGGGSDGSMSGPSIGVAPLGGGQWQSPTMLALAERRHRARAEAESFLLNEALVEQSTAAAAAVAAVNTGNASPVVVTDFEGLD